jgi:hypothetical protein
LVLESHSNLKELFKAGARVFFCFILYVLFWSIITPISFLVLKSTKLSYRLLFYIPLFLIILNFAGFLSLWLLSVPFLCTELALHIDKNEKLRAETYFQLIVVSVGLIGHLALYVAYDLAFPKAVDLNLYDWFFKIDQFWINLQLQIPADSKSSEWLQFSWFNYIGYFSSIYFLSFILGVFTCFWRSSILDKFKAPDILFWFTTFTFALGFLNWGPLFTYIGFDVEIYALFEANQIYSQNISVILSGIYFFQGLSVSSYLMKKFKIARFWQNLWYILIILNLPLILVVLGLMDFLFEFRSFKETK